MAKRRGNDEGSVYQDKDGVWWAKLSPDENGKRPKRRANSQKEALALLREMQRERARGVDLTAKQPTVASFAETWLEQVVKRACSALTHASYETVLNAYVVPRIGSIRLDKLTTPRIQQLVNDLTDEGYKPATVRNPYLRLRAMLGVAVEWRLIAHNVALGVRLPKIDKNAQRALCAADVRTFLAAVEGLRNTTLYHLYFGLGVRRGEGLGALWRDLDWDASTLKITQQIQPLRGKTVTGTPKNDKPRTLPLPDHLLERLHEHWRNQQEERRLLGLTWKEHGLIFPSEVGTPISPRNLNRQFATMVAKAGLSEDVHVHTARHTCATLLGELGTEERVIGAILGHAPANVTAMYAKTTLPMMRAALDSLAHELIKKAA